MVSIIVAMTSDRVIGRDGTLPWRLKSDLERFKQLTDGCPVIMGRKTYESIPSQWRPLKNRTNIILTHNRAWQAEGCLVAHSLDEAIVSAINSRGGNEIFVIGGAEVYSQALGEVDCLYITMVDARVEGDCYFPQFNYDDWIIRDEGGFESNEVNQYSGRFWVCERRLPNDRHQQVVIPENARTKEYLKILDEIQRTGQCPYCPNGLTLKEQKILTTNRSWYLTNNVYPLAGAECHYIIIARRHVEDTGELTSQEWSDLGEIQEWYLGGKGTIFYGRSGNPYQTGATVFHLHFHLIIPTTGEKVVVHFGSTTKD